METVNCNLCGADDAEILFEGRDLWFELPGRFPVNRCRSCGLIYLSPRPERSEIGQYYPREYEPFLPAIDDERSTWRRLNRRYDMFKKMRLLQSRVRERGRVLDIGCATGGFLDALRWRGWDVRGVELDAHAAMYARTRLGLDVYIGELADATFPDEYFDLVTMWHVLEHLHDPRSTLIEAARVARPDGTLLLGLPDPESLEARVFGPHWAGWDFPRHLYILSQSVIRRMLKETGWQVFEIVGASGRMWLLNQSLRYWLENRLSSARLRRLILSTSGSELVRAAFVPYFMLIERMNKGSAIAVFARRVS